MNVTPAMVDAALIEKWGFDDLDKVLPNSIAAERESMRAWLTAALAVSGEDAEVIKIRDSCIQGSMDGTVPAKYRRILRYAAQALSSITGDQS